MSYSKPLMMDPDPGVLLDTEDTISLDTTTDDNFSQNFLLGTQTIDAEPLSLDPRVRIDSVESQASRQIEVNPYFKHLQSNKMQPHTMPRNKITSDKDWKAPKELRDSQLEEIADLAIQIIKDTRHKLTKLITDVAVLFPFLKQKEVLTANDCDRIDQQRLRSLKTDALIDIIITRGIKGVVYFCESLRIHYNHLYVTLKHIFEINGIEIESILDNGGRKAKVISEIFRSIEDIMGPKFAQERLDAQHILDTISAVKMDNVSSQDINELREKYIELQNHYQPIQHIIDTLTNDITNKYTCLTYENEAALAAIDKLHSENRENYEKMKSLHLKLELQQDELERSRITNHEGVENTALYQKVLDLDPSDEKLEVIRLNKLLVKEKTQNAELMEQIDVIRKEKDELFDLNQKILKENADWKQKSGTSSHQGAKYFDDSTLKSNEHMVQLEALSDNLKQKNKDIIDALEIISSKKSGINKVVIKNSIPIENIIKQHLAQSIEIGAFFSDNLDRSLVRSFQPGDRILRINNIKLNNIKNTNFPHLMMQQAENTLKILIARGSISMGRVPYEEHNFTLTQDEMSRCPSPMTFIDGGRLTPVPSDYQRRISNQSHDTLIKDQTGMQSQSSMYDLSAYNRIRAETIINRDLLSSDRNFFENFKNVSSCPPTPRYDTEQGHLKISANNLSKRDVMKSLAHDSGSDTLSQDSDPSSSHTQEILRRPNLLNIGRDNPAFTNRIHRFEPDTSPMLAKEFPGTSLDAMPDLFNSRTDTGITGMIIFPRSQTFAQPSPSAEDTISQNKDQLCVSVSSEVFLKYAKISGGFGNPFFLNFSKELQQFRLKPGQKIYQIDDISTEYLTYEMFIAHCNQSPMLTLFVSFSPSPEFKPDEASVRDHFYVISHFTTNSIRMKGELFVSPSCVYLVTDTMFSKDNTSKQNRYWHVTRIDPRNCNTIEKGVIPSDMWLDYSMNRAEDSFEVIESRGPQSLTSSVTDVEVFEHEISYYYDVEGVRNKQEIDFTKSLFSCYTLVTRQDHLPQPVILFDYHWEEYSERLTSQNNKNLSQKTKFHLITPVVIENVDHAKNAELEARHKAYEIIYYKGTDGKARFVDAKSLRDCAENDFMPVLLCPIAQIYNAPLLVELNPIVIRLKFKYKYRFDIPLDQRFHFDDMLSVGLSEEKYLKKLVNLIESNRVLYEWKAVVIEK